MTTRVAKTPGVDGRIFLPKINSICSGRPRSRLSATSASKNARPLRGAGRTPCVRDTSICRIDNSHQYPAARSAGVSGTGSRASQRSKKRLDLDRAEPVTDRLQRGRVVAARRNRSPGRPADPGLGGLPFRPLVAVQPYLDRIREVGADLDERRPELVVPDIEVVAGDPPLGPVPAEMRRPTVAGLGDGAGRDPLELLRPADRRHPGPARPRLPSQIRLHLLDLALTLAELDHRDLVAVGERAHRPAEPVTDPTHHRRRRDREPARGQELHDLPTDLQIRHIPVQIDPVQTLQVQPHMPIQNVCCPHRTAGHQRTPAPA